MAVPTTLVIDATQETLEITNSRDATALRGYSIEAGPPTDGEGLFFQASSSEYVFRTVDESIDDRVAELIQDSAAGGLTWTYDDSAGTLTPAYVGDSTLVTTGALNSGSITSGFTSIDVGAGAITTTGTVTGGVLAGTLSTAAQGNVTSLGTLTTLTVSGNFYTHANTSLGDSSGDITTVVGTLNWNDGGDSAISIANAGTDASSILAGSSDALYLGGNNTQALALNVDGSATFAGNITGDLTGDVTGNADTATALETARTIGGTSFDGTASIVPATITVADTTDTTSYVALFESATGDLAPKTDTGVTYNAGTGILTATGFAGPLTGNVTGNVTGSSGSTTGNAATATALETARTIGGTSFDGTANIAVALAATATALASARTIGGVSFDGTGNIVPGTITVADTTDTTSYVALFESATGDLGPKTDAGITYNAGTGLLTATGFSGPLTGNVTGDCSGSSGSTTGNAATATLASTVTVADSSDTTAFPAFFDSATGSLAIMTDASNLTYNASTGVLTATGFAGPLTGNVTGDVSGSSGSTTGNAATATALQTARTIGGTSFDGTGNIVPATITVADTTDTTSYVAFFESATGDLGPKTDAGATYNAATGVLTATGFAGPLTGNVTGNVTGSSGSTTGLAATATALATARAINGVDFDGTAAITVTAAAGTLSGATLASGVTASSLTSTGTLTSLAVGGTTTIDPGAANRELDFGSTSNNYASRIRMLSATIYNWQVSSGWLVASDFEITPSTAGGGTTFSTPALKIAGATSAATFGGNVGINIAASARALNVLQATSAQEAAVFAHSHGTNVAGVLVNFTGGVIDNRTKYFFRGMDTAGTKLNLWSDGGANFSGAVAIGTTSAPSATYLDLGGATNSYTGDAIILDGGNGGLFITDNTKYLGFWATHGGSSFDSSTMGTRSNHALSLMTNDTKALTIDTSQNVGIDNTAPSADLEIGSNDDTISRLKIRYSSVPLQISNGYDGTYGLNTISSNCYSSATGSTQSWTDVGNTSYSLTAIQLADTTSGGEIRFFTAAASNTDPSQRMTIDKNGNVGIGTTSPGSLLEVASGSNATPIKIGTTTHNYAEFTTTNTDGDCYTVYKNTGDGNYSFGVGRHAGGYMAFTTDSGGGNPDDVRMVMHTDGNVGIGTTSPAYQLEVNGTCHIAGALSKTSGSFRIDHPLPSKSETHDLVHSFIEGPRADLIYRGTVDLSGGYAQVDLDDAAGMTEGTWELLCRDPQCWIQNDTGWGSVRGAVEGNTLTVECESTDSDDTVSWMVVAERCDPHMMETEWTDDSGRVIVEPEKEEE